MRSLLRSLGIALGVFGIAGVGVAASPAWAGQSGNTVPLKDSQRNTPETASGFSDDDCGGLDLSEGTVWHFVANGLTDGSVAVSFTAQFGPAANTVTETIGDVPSLRRSNDGGTTWQFFVQSTQPVLVDAVAEFDRAQPAGIDLQLSHICPRSSQTTTTTTSTSTPTTAATVPAAVLGSTTNRPAQVAGTTQAQPLPRTGTASVPLIVIAVSLILTGFVLTMIASNGHPLGYRRR